jgi:hypothetical protein
VPAGGLRRGQTILFRATPSPFFPSLSVMDGPHPDDRGRLTVTELP